MSTFLPSESVTVCVRDFVWCVTCCRVSDPHAAIVCIAGSARTEFCFHRAALYKVIRYDPPTTARGRLNNDALRRGAREALEQVTRALERRVGAGCGLGQREAVEREHGGAAGLVAHEVEQRVTRLLLH